MLLSVKALRGGAIAARDERFGFIVDLYFEDESWRLRYIVLDTGRPMPQRSVLIDPESIARIDRAEATVHVALTRAQIEKKPDWTTALPVYLQHDMTPRGHAGDEHLRSSEIVGGCSVLARDGAVGRVADLLLDTESLALAQLVVDTGYWFTGKRAAVPCTQIERIDWLERKIHLRVERQALRASSGEMRVQT
jgi:hypothetical protein